MFQVVVLGSRSWTVCLPTSDCGLRTFERSTDRRVLAHRIIPLPHRQTESWEVRRTWVGH